MKCFKLMFVVLLLVQGALADGKMYMEKVSPDIPYQRALIMYDGQEQTMVLQSKYAEPTAEASDIGWVVPLPAVPELASCDSDSASRLFRFVSAKCGPNVIHVAPWFVLPFMIITILMLLDLPKKAREKRAQSCLVVVIMVIVLFFLAAMSLPLMGANDVESLKAEQVGIYDVEVIKAENPDDLIDWFKENRFFFDEKDRAAIAHYVDQGWCFVTAHIRPDKQEDAIGYEGLANPLIMRFPTPKAVYPLALTGTGGHDTKVLIYLASKNKMLCGDRLELEYAAPLKDGIGLFFAPEEADPESFFTEEQLQYPYICKFKGTLSPEEMKDDLYFSEALDNSEVQKTIVRW